MFEVGKAFLINLLPATLLYLGRYDGYSTFVLDHKIFEEASSINTSQQIIFFVGLFWTCLYSPIQIANAKRQLDEKTGQFNRMLEIYKDIYLKSVKEKLKIRNVKLNTRLFVQKRSLTSIMDNLLRRKIKFVIKHIPELCDPFDFKDLEFEVHPKVQGLVGQAFSSKRTVVDCNLSQETYNLSDFQKSITTEVKFCSAVPIFSSDDRVKVILAIDSPNQMNFTQTEIKMWEESMKFYSVFVKKVLSV